MAKSRMTPSEFKEIREELGLTQERLSQRLNKSLSSVQDNERGRSQIPGVVAEAMRLLRENSMLKGRIAELENEIEHLGG